MTVNTEVQNEQSAQVTANDKEYNFAQIRKVNERLENENHVLKKELGEIKNLLQQNQSRQEVDLDEEDSEDLVSNKKLSRKLTKNNQEIKQDVEQKVHKALADERKRMWLSQNPDFESTLNQYAQKIAEMDPDYAKTIVEMPIDDFEKQKMVYKNIKMLGLDKPKEEPPKIQETIDKNRRGAFYQPTGIGTPPYGVYSTGGREVTPEVGKQAYEKLLQLKANLRL